MSETLCVAIIARDEARHIGAALESAAQIADEVLVLLDDRSTDTTAGIAAQHGATVRRERFVSFPAQRNRALDLCRSAWVLFLDADERVMPDLAAEILAWRRRDDQPHVGYWIPRRNLYFGRPLRGGGWYPDRQLRLLRRSAVRYDETRLVHELVVADGSTGELSGHLLHFNIETWPELREKQRRYAIAEAQTLALGGTRARWRNLTLQPLREIKRRFVTWHGYRDGALGATLALTMGYYELIKYIHLKALGAVSRA